MRFPRSRRLVLGLAALAATTLLAPAAPATAAAASCATGWRSEVVADRLGALENLEADGEGGFYATGIVRGELLHIDRAGTVTTLLTGLDHPAGLRLVDRTLYFLTGDGSTPNGGGTLRALDLATDRVTVLLPDLVQPNGLLVLPDGDLLVSQLSIPWPPVGLSRYRPRTGELTLGWSAVPRPNGMALTPDGGAVLTVDVATSQLVRIPLTDPQSPTAVATVADGFLTGLDDLDITAAGTVYIAGDYTGSVYRVDPTGGFCTVATGWIAEDAGPFPPIGPTSVRIARDGDRWALYVTAIDGALRRLIPPAGVDLTPPRA